MKLVILGLACVMTVGCAVEHPTTEGKSDTTSAIESDAPNLPQYCMTPAGLLPIAQRNTTLQPGDPCEAIDTQGDEIDGQAATAMTRSAATTTRRRTTSSRRTA